MSTTEVILRLGLVSLLGIYLLHRHWRRVVAAAPRPGDPSRWTGHGIDASQLDMIAPGPGQTLVIETVDPAPSPAPSVVAAR